MVIFTSAMFAAPFEIENGFTTISKEYQTAAPLPLLLPESDVDEHLFALDLDDVEQFLSGEGAQR